MEGDGKTQPAKTSGGVAGSRKGKEAGGAIVPESRVWKTVVNQGGKKRKKAHRQGHRPRTCTGGIQNEGQSLP